MSTNPTPVIENVPRGWVVTDADNNVIPVDRIAHFASGSQIKIDPIEEYDFSSINLYSPDYSVKVVVDYSADYTLNRIVKFESLPQVPGIGAIAVYSTLKFSAARVFNSAGAMVAQALSKEDSAFLPFIQPGTYTVETLAIDGNSILQRITGVNVVAGTTLVELTEAALVDPNAPKTRNTLHSIRMTGLQAGDRVTLLRGTDEAASAIAQDHADINFNGLADAEYTVNVAFTNGTMANRYASLNADSSSVVVFDVTDARSPIHELITNPNGDSNVTWWVLAGIAGLAGAAWYADRQGIIKLPI